MVVVLAVRVRWPGLTNLGLFRDDAWLALASRVGFVKAVHMGATAPGFTLLERLWIGVDPRSTRWAQALPLLAGVAGPIAIFFLVRFWRLRLWIALLAAFAMATSPEAVQYATHLKPYTTDVLLACLLLWRGEAARRSPTTSSLFTLAAVCGAAFAVSGSVIPIVVASWAAICLANFRSREALRRVAMAGVPLAICLGGIYLLLLRGLPPALYRFWAANGDFLNTTSPVVVWHKLGRSATVITVGLFAPAGRVDIYGGAIVHSSRIFWPAVLFVTLLALGLTSRGPASIPALSVLAALAASAAGKIPFGTGRSDLVLYPALLLLAALGLSRVAHFGGQVITRLPNSRYIASAGILVVLVLAVVASLLSNTVRHPPRYPGVNVRAIAEYVSKHRHSGDDTLVDPYTRYGWDLYEAKVVRVEFGESWGAGFTVLSDQSNVFLAPSDPYENGYDPQGWVHEVSSARRVWYVGTFFLSRQDDPLYQGLLHAGYRAQSEFDTTGGFAILFARSNG